MASRGSCRIFHVLMKLRIDSDDIYFCLTFYVNIELYSTFAGHIWASFGSYEDDIDTNRILIQKTTSLTVRNPPFELSGIGV